jgi:uncharacterized membrane protein
MAKATPQAVKTLRMLRERERWIFIVFVVFDFFWPNAPKLKSGT